MRAYGWDTRGRIIDAEADELRGIAKRVADGDPIRHIVNDLRDREITTVTGKAWTHRTITRAVQNPRIVGMRLRDEQVEPDPDVAAILDMATWEKINTRLSSADRQKFTPRSRRPGADQVEQPLLAGLIFCALCGGPMYLLEGNYACGGSGCPRVFIRQTIAEAEVSEQALMVVTSPPWLQALAEVSGLGADHYRKVIEDARGRMVRLAEEFGGGGHPDAFDAGVAAARRVQAEAEKDLAVLDATGALPLLSAEAIVTWWNEDASLERKRALVSAVVAKVTVRRTADSGSGAERIAIEWR
ncbi:recombinase family protein [Gordonia sp. (in: high G+C Gram-positive bacteria)]|uniref:recombinase family protein n=1 Tax=Gordonia sp. (in: high G+C Gram-positive bacteria) TaxID=84139 RepID=UPI00333F4C92